MAQTDTSSLKKSKNNVVSFKNDKNDFYSSVKCEAVLKYCDEQNYLSQHVMHMKSVLSSFLICCCLHSSAQFAIVTDNDGYVNVREDADIKSKIINKLNTGHLIYCFENKGNWTNIDYTLNNKECNGYIYKDKYNPIDDYINIPVYKQTENKVVLKKDSISITLTSASFDKKKHHFKYLKDYPDQINLIDNKKYWGKDGGMPSSQYEKIVISHGKKTNTVPFAALQGLYEPNMFSPTATFDYVNDVIYIQSMNSDGAGSYEVIWRIEKGEYKERLVVYGF